jgi:SAM-dependent methyltransferase
MNRYIKKWRYKMKSSNLINRILVILLLNFIASGVYSQQQTKSNEFVPQIGQDGKDVIWVPTPEELVKKMLEIAWVAPTDFVVDLGSGDGRTVIAAAKLGAKATGIEYNPDMVELSRKNAREAGVEGKATFINTDLFEYDLSDATVITMFLLPDINLKLRPKLLNLRPGTRIVSNTFTMGEWEPDIEATTEDNWNSWNTALMWVVPAKVEGTWDLGGGELSIHQEFQMIFGTYKKGDKTSSISDGRLNGSEITFRIDGEVYTGRVNGNKSMLGTATLNSRKSDWSATRKSD